MRTICSALGLALLAPAAAFAQGSLGTQGFGYPAGQHSTRSAGMGNSLAEVDPMSVVNPAALGVWGRSGLYVQYAPEFRRVEVGGQRDNITVPRFPLISAGINVRQRYLIGISASTFLDRTWETNRSGTEPVPGGDPAAFTESFRSTGGISDVRLAGAMIVNERVRVGLGGHAYIGENQLDIRRAYEDDRSLPFQQRTSLSFSGNAFTAGVDWQPTRVLTVGASGRIGGALRAYIGDTLQSRGNAPSRLGVGTRYTGFTGTVLAARVGWQGWSAMADLSQNQVAAHDALEFGAGAEFRGPTLGRGPIPLRIGFEQRGLPFEAGGSRINERTISTGIGIPFFAPRSTGDISVQRASRSGPAGVNEHSWIIGIGISIRP